MFHTPGAVKHVCVPGQRLTRSPGSVAERGQPGTISGGRSSEQSRLAARCVWNGSHGGADGEEGKKLHDEGGPCNHGSKEIDSEVWFPLTGNQTSAHVCVFVPGAVPGNVSVGARSQNQCIEATENSPYCSNCGTCPDT